MSRADVAFLTSVLYEWHRGSIDHRQFDIEASKIANNEEIDQLKEISKYGYCGKDELSKMIYLSMNKVYSEGMTGKL